MASPKDLIDKLGGKFSTSLKINLSSLDPQEVFKWFLASILFGARISETIVVKTYKTFERERVLSPERILKIGWEGLVKILDAGGYVRYDFKTADKLLEVMESLMDNYEGDLQDLHDRAEDSRDLERRLQGLGKGIGGVTTNIFLRELRGLWPKANPLPSELVIKAAKNLGQVSRDEPEAALEELKAVWEENRPEKGDFADFEAALVRLGKDYCRKRRCPLCPLREDCRWQGAAVVVKNPH